MSKELPFFKFNSAEWLTGDISLENYRTQGIFISLCAEYWQRDCILTLKCVKKRLKLNQKSLETLTKLDLISIQNDCVFIDFLDEQFEELSEKHRKRVNSGRRGGKQRASNASSNAKAPLKHKDIDIEVDKEIDIEEETLPAKPAKADLFSDEDIELARVWGKSVCERSPSFKLKKEHGPKWADTIRLMRERDNRSIDEIAKFMDAVHNDEFWSGNIFDIKKLRKQINEGKLDKLIDNNQTEGEISWLEMTD